MRRLTIFFLSLCCISAFLEEKDPFPEIEKFKLKNGMEIMFADFGQLPVTSVNMFFNVGTKNETPGQQGMCMLTTDVLLMGNEKYSRVEQDQRLFRIAGDISISSNSNFTIVSADFLNKDADMGMDLLSSAIMKPLFRQQDVDEQKEFYLATNKTDKMDISQLAGLYGDYVTFGLQHPLGRHFYETQFNKITTAQIREFYSFNFTPGNCKVVVTGKCDRVKMKELLEKCFGGWSAPYGEMNSSAYDIPAIKDKEYFFVAKTNAEQAAITWTKRAPEAGSKDVLAFRVANNIFTEYLMNEIREKRGYTYGIYSAFSEGDNTGVFRASTQVRNEVMYSTLEAFDVVLNDFYTKGPQQKDLDKIKARMRAGLMSIEDPGSFAMLINPLVYKDYSKRKLVLAEFDKLDLAAINKVIKKYFTPGSYKVVIAGDANVLNPQLEKMTGLKRLELGVIERDE